MNCLPQNLKILRKSFGLSQKELGDAIGVSKSTISGFELDTHPPQPYDKAKLAKHFKLTIEDLEGREISLEEAERLAKREKNKEKSSRSSEEESATYGAGGSGKPAAFRNDASRRFYEWYHEQFESGNLNKKEVGEDLQLGGHSYTYGFWNMLRDGKISVDIDQLQLAEQKHGINPLFILGYSDQMDSKAPVTFRPAREEAAIAVHVGTIIDTILTKHQTPRTRYAEEVLNKTPRTLQRLIKGEITPDFITVAQIAQDHGESLDLFRPGPFPKGHLLELMKAKDEIIEQQRQIISMLQAKSA